MRTKRGFSIIEIAIALALLALVLGGTLSVLDRGFSSARKTRQSAIAYSLIREKLEEFSSSTYPSLFFTPNPSCPCPPYTAPPDEARAAVSGFTGYDREVDVTCPYLGFNNLARITVTVWWNNGAQSQSISTLKANY